MLLPKPVLPVSVQIGGLPALWVITGERQVAQPENFRST